jgi:biopolymer transport protein TolQ
MDSLQILCPAANVLYALEQSDLAGKVIVAVLFVGSMLSWTVMLSKSREIGAARKGAMRFLSAYRQEAHPAALFIKRQPRQPNPLAAVYEKTCVALGGSLEARGADRGDLFMGGMGAAPIRLHEAHMAAVRNTAERTVADQALVLESSMGLLATATTAAPFLGLLGTVWGVMDAFGGMATTGSALLSEVAPGISAALLTTVVGLLVALPSVIGYNLLSDRIRHLTVQVDNFAQELIADIERHYLEH